MDKCDICGRNDESTRNIRGYRTCKSCEKRDEEQVACEVCGEYNDEEELMDAEDGRSICEACYWEGDDDEDEDDDT